jgi:hypothetical protein
MGVGKSMKIFMEGMQNSMNVGGNGGKILNTPMGPFQWNEALQMWVNTNNGFQMPNISMQDLLAIGYDSGSEDASGGGGGNPVGVCTQTLTSISTTVRSIYSGQSTTFPSTTNSYPSLTCSPSIYVSDEVGIATHQLGISYSINGGSSYTTLTTLPVANLSRTEIPFAVGASLGGTVRFSATKKPVGGEFANPGLYTFYIRNAYDNSIIGQVNITTQILVGP